jgi:hypothetical protein
MIRLKQVLPFAALLLSSSFAAQAVETTYAFGNVIAIDYGTSLSITGVLLNNSAPTTITLPMGLSIFDRCQDFIVAMINNPGSYRLTIAFDSQPNPLDPNNSLYSLTRCRLERPLNLPVPPP